MAQYRQDSNTDYAYNSVRHSNSAPNTATPSFQILQIAPTYSSPYAQSGYGVQNLPTPFAISGAYAQPGYGVQNIPTPYAIPQPQTAPQYDVHYLLQENQRLQNILNTKSATINSLTLENTLLRHNNSILIQQATETQPVFYNEDKHHLSLLSSTISTTIERPGVFENKVLSLPALSSLDLKTPLALPPLQFRLEEGQNISTYFQQFIPFILEEVRAGIAAEIEKISTQQLRPFTAQFEPGTISAAGDYAVSLSCRTKALPKVDHLFQNEAVLIVINKTEAKSLAHTKKKWDSHQPLQGFLAIATTHFQKISYEQRDRNEPRETEFFLTLLKDQYEQHAAYLSANDYTLEIHWLLGLIPAARDYEACIHSNKISLESQIVHGHLPAWPKQAHQFSSTNTAVHSAANEDVPSSLERARRGIYCLQGPAGTGKTTTIVNLQKKWVTHYPNERILVCTPSNSAVQVVYARTQAALPDVCMAILVHGKASSETKSNAWVNHHAENLLRPLEDLHAQQDADPRERQAKMLAEYGRIFEELHELSHHPRTIHVKEAIKQRIKELEIYFLNQAHPLNEENRDLEMDNLDENLKKSIQMLKDNKSYLECFLIQRAQIIYTTLAGSGRDFLKKQGLSIKRLLIDEAGQATIPTTLIPFVHHNPDIGVLVGDHKQLPATILSKNARDMRYDTSLLASFIAGEQAEPYKMLNKQYRMHPNICAYASDQFYAGALETDDSVMRRPPFLTPLSESVFSSPALFFDIRGKEVFQEHSFINEKEAWAIVDTTHYLLQHGLQSKQIGIITFYAAQVSRILTYLSNKLRPIPKDLIVSTVDSFQGDERDVILISAVRTKPSLGFLADPNRINVSTTRAKQRLCLFAHAEAIAQSDKDLAQYANYAQVVPEKELRSEIGYRHKPS